MNQESVGLSRIYIEIILSAYSENHIVIVFFFLRKLAVVFSAVCLSRFHYTGENLLSVALVCLKFVYF